MNISTCVIIIADTQGPPDDFGHGVSRLRSHVFRRPGAKRRPYQNPRRSTRRFQSHAAVREYTALFIENRQYNSRTICLTGTFTRTTSTSARSSWSVTFATRPRSTCCQRWSKSAQSSCGETSTLATHAELTSLPNSLRRMSSWTKDCRCDITQTKLKHDH